MIEAQKYSPFELGMARLVDLGKGPFVGPVGARRRASPRPSPADRRVSRWTGRRSSGCTKPSGLPPTAPAAASRVAVPVYRDGRQVGRATSTTWSTTLKKLIALATIDAPHHAMGTRLQLEITVEAVRHSASATVVKTPFFNPPRKTATPPYRPAPRQGSEPGFSLVALGARR